MGMDKNGIFVTFEYNGREIEGIDEFRKEVDGYYSSLGKAVYIPSFSEGGELFLKVFFESDWGSFVATAIAGGLLWDVVKYAGKTFVLTPLANAIDKLFLTNDKAKGGYGLKLVSSRLVFEDIEIVVFGLTMNYREELEKILYHISTRIEQIESEHGSGISIRTIEFPYYYEEYNDDKYLRDSLNDSYSNKHLLKVIFEDGSCYYEEYNV